MVAGQQATRKVRRIHPSYPFELREAKLTPPFVRPGTVARAKLVNRLRASRALPVVSMVAPPGFGKTTALALWADVDKRPFGWVSLEESENDPISLLAYVAAALECSEPLGRRVFESLSTPNVSVEATVVPRLGSALRARNDPVVIVLDDVHRLTNPACASAVVALSRHLPDGSQLAIAGRQQPEIPVARFRTEGRLLEIGTTDLALDLDEATDLLRCTGFNPSPPEIEQLHQQTEGWAAGLYLAGLSLNAQQGNGARPSFDGSDRFAVDYLWSELLSHLSPADVGFLTRSSILSRMCGPLCDAVVGGSGGADALDDLERSNRFVLALDRRRHWYRFHRIFREVLTDELEKRQPDQIPELHRRAARWLESNGSPEEAFNHWFQSGDTERAGVLTSQLAPLLMRTGRMATLRSWLHQLPEEVIEDHPSLVISMILVGGFTDEPATAERWADIVERSVVRRGGSVATSDRASVHLIRALMCRRGVAQMLEDAEAAVNAEPERMGAVALLGVAHLLSGDQETADRVLAHAIEGGLRAGAVTATAAAAAERCLLAFSSQEWSAVADPLRQSFDMIDVGGLHELGQSALTYAASARLALHTGDVPRAQRDFNRAQRLLPLMTRVVPWAAVQVRLELARVNLGLSDPGGARTLLSEISDILVERPDLGTLGEEVMGFREQVNWRPPSGLPGPSSLSTAELRVLALLPTYLSFAEIGRRLHLSANTVKTEAIAIYRKLGVSSRSEAVDGARRIGLLDQEADFIHCG